MFTRSEIAAFQEFIKDPQKQRELLWHMKLRQPGELDVIRLESSKEIETVTDVVHRISKSDIKKYIQAPALKSFKLFLSLDEAPPEKKNMQIDLIPDNSDGLATIFAFVEDENSRGHIEAVYSLYLTPDTEEPGVYCMMHVDCREDEYLVELSKNGEIYFMVYMGVQHLLYNRPTIFKESIGRTGYFKSPKAGKKARAHNKKIKAYKIITLNPEEWTKKAPKGDDYEKYSTYSALCWGVMGHQRKYKSGKVVWIAPYKKGRDRNKEDAKYTSKEYEIVQEQEG